MLTHIDTGVQTQNILGKEVVIALGGLSVETLTVNCFERPNEVTFPEGAEWIQKR